MKMIMSKIGENIKKYRELRGLTQEQLAHKLGYKSKGAVANWENGLNSPNDDKLEMLLSILDVDANTLFGWPEQMKSDAEELANIILSDKKIKKLIEALKDMSEEDLNLVLSFAERLKKGATKDDNN